MIKECEGFDDNLLNVIEDLFDKWIEPLLIKKREMKQNEICPLSEASQVKGFCLLLGSFIEKIFGEVGPPTNSSEEFYQYKIEKCFVFCAVWALGSNLNPEGRIAFDNYLRDIEGIIPFS